MEQFYYIGLHFSNTFSIWLQNYNPSACCSSNCKINYLTWDTNVAIATKSHLLPPHPLRLPPPPPPHQSWRSRQAGCTPESLAVNRRNTEYRPISSTVHDHFKKQDVLMNLWDVAHLVGVLEDEVLALVQLAADIDDAAQDAPGVLHAQIDLAGKLVGLELLRSQHHVTGRVLSVVPRHVPEGQRGRQSVHALTHYGLWSLGLLSLYS